MADEYLYAEFERLGEAEVLECLIHKRFKEERRVYALRWLGERGLARALAADRAARAHVVALAKARRDRQAILAGALFLLLALAVLALFRHGLLH